MSRHHWYRNETWDEAIEAEFQQRLRRSREGKPQYLRIQAGYLESSYPQVALRLIEQYFREFDDNFDKASAYCVQSAALLSMGKTEEALDAWVLAIERQIQYPNFLTTALSSFLVFVVKHRLSHRYDQALDLFERSDTENLFLPIARYRIFGAVAIILYEMGRKGQSKIFLDRAIEAVFQEESGFSKNKNFGLVKDLDDDFGRRVADIVGSLYGP